MKEIIVKINKETGEVEIEASGFSGKECEEATKAFEESVGKVESRKRKPEYYQREYSKMKVRN